MKKIKSFRISQKIISFILAAAIIFTSLPYREAAASTNGFGIKNDLHSSDSNLTNTYSLKFYKLVDVPTQKEDEQGNPVFDDEDNPVMEHHYSYVVVPLSDEITLHDTLNQNVFLEENGTLVLKKGQEVHFDYASNSELYNFLLDNDIARIAISFEENEKLNDQGDTRQAFQLYETTDGFSGDPSAIDNDTTNPPTGDPASNPDANTKVYKINYTTDSGTGVKSITDIANYAVKEFDSTAIVDHNVTVIWRDRDAAARPDNDDITFDLQRKTEGENYSDYTPTIPRTIETKSSSEVVYTYRVPEYSENDEKYTYKATETNSNPYSVTTGGNTTTYVHENKQNDDNTFINANLRDFTCTFSWLDEAHHNDITATVDKDFIKTRFTLQDETGSSVVNVDLDDPNITISYNSATGQLTISGLRDFDNEGNAKIYSLKPKQSTVPVNDIDTKEGDAYTGSDADNFILTAENSGVRTDVVDRVFENGVLELTLKGPTTFGGTLNWSDDANQSGRISAVNNGSAGSFMLYRYVDGHPELVSQVGTWNINPSTDPNNPDQYTFTYPQTLDKYDVNGNEYIYFAKEMLSLADYEVQYDFSGANYFPFSGTSGSYIGVPVFPNGANVTNKLTGSIVHHIDAEWIAAALQGGSASISYQLQKFVPADPNVPSSTDHWETVTITGPGITNNTLTIDGFSAELMELGANFPAVPKYDEDGNVNHYRIIQTDTSRTDSGIHRTYSDDLVMECDQNGNVVTVNDEGKTRVKLEGEDADGNKLITLTGSNGEPLKFNVRVYKEGNSYYYKYTLVDDVQIIIDKDWSNVPLDNIVDAWNAQVGIKIMVMDYKTGLFAPFDTNHGNTGNISYTDSEDNDYTVDTDGTVTVTRTRVYDNDKYCVLVQNLPKYDEYGHLNKYNVAEVTNNAGGGVSYVIDTNRDPVKYTVINSYGGDGETITFHKIWMDDGEEEYKSDVRIDVSSRALPMPGEFSDQGVITLDGWEDYTDKDELEAAIERKKQEAQTPSTGTSGVTTWGADSNNFSPFVDDLFSSDGLGYYYKNNTATRVPNQLDPADYPNLDITAFNTALSNIQNSGHLLMPGINLNDLNMWQNELGVRKYYPYSKLNGQAYPGYNLKDFKEYLTSSSIRNHDFQFVPTGDIVETPSDAWMDMIPSDYTAFANGTTIGATSLLNNTLTYGNGTSDPTTFEWLAGVYTATYNKGTNSYTRYYAVQETPTITTLNNGQDEKLTDVTFTNTRIGVVNFKIDFDWKLGLRMDGLGNDDIQNITVKLEADLDRDGTYVPVYVDNSDEITISVNKDLQCYYITNLPKYNNENGKIIKYRLREVKIGGVTITNNSDGSQGHCDLNGDNLNVSITEEPYVVNRSSNSDDLIPITITNYFKGTRPMTVNKIWLDDSNALDRRSDLVINLFRHTTKNNADWNNATQIGKDYLWVRDPDEPLNHWSYTFTDLDRYDDNGYEYDYYIKEITTILSTHEYKTAYSNTDAKAKYSDYNTNGRDANAENGRCYNGCTITNYLYGTTTVPGIKNWYGIDKSNFADANYPIADIFLYKWEKAHGPYDTIQSRDNKYYISIQEISGENIGELINISQIINGADRFGFDKQKTIKKENDQYVYHKLGNSDHNDYVEFNEPDDDGKLLMKYDSIGAKIKYSVQERAINGYTFNISNDTTINATNEYTGGNPIQVRVKKTWENMAQAPAKPIIEVTLHQAYVGKNSSGNWDLIDYHTFTQPLYGNNDYEYTFGGPGNPEDLREYAPTGNKFIYYVTEKLTSADGKESVEFKRILLKVDGNNKTASFGDVKRADGQAPEGLGFVCTQISVVEHDDKYPNDSLKFKSELKNIYQPDDNNFKSTITVNKEWEQYKGSEQNTGNDEFSSIRDYSFYLKRKTRNYHEPQKLLRLNTTGGANGEPTIQTGSYTETNFTIIDSTFTLKNDSPENYYESTVTFTKEDYNSFLPGNNDDKVQVKVKVYAVSRKVVFEGFAVYAQDGIPYTYIVDEVESTVFKPREQNVSKEIVPTKDVNGNVTGGTVTLDLKNVLRQFTLRLNKVFGTMYDDNGTKKYAVLSPDDYKLFFDDNFKNRLRFTLQRTTVASPVESDWVDYKVDIPGSSLTKYTSGAYNGQYYYDFKYVPIYDSAGKVYKYRVVEDETNIGSHVRVFYPANNNQVPDDGWDPLASTNPSPKSTPVTVSPTNADDGQVRNTYVRNIFEGKKIKVKKYWKDNGNADGMRPESLDVTMTEKYVLNQISKQTQFNKTILDSEGWSKDLILPAYYYNGNDPIADIQFTVAENLLTARQYANGPTLSSLHYSQSDQGYLINDGGTETRQTNNFTSLLTGTSDDEFLGLYLENSKDPVNSKLTVQKQWENDGNNKWSSRPEHIYFKVLRTSAGGNSIQINSGTGTFTISSTDFTNGTFTGLIADLPAKAADNSDVDYKLSLCNSSGTISDDQSALSASVFTDPSGGKGVSFTITGHESGDVYVKLQRSKSGSSSFTDWKKDKNGSPLSIKTASGQETVKTDNNSNPISATLGGQTYPSDSNGVITLPGNADIDDAVIQNLAYGNNTGGTEQNNGSFSQYYYTLVECDKNGTDAFSTMTYTQTDNAAEANTAAKLSFTIDTSSYHPVGGDVRKHINIKIYRGTKDNDIVTRDINGDPIRVIINGEYYYASTGGTPADGVVVIPVPLETDSIDCVVENLPYAPESNGGWGSTQYAYGVARCKASGATHGSALPLSSPPVTTADIPQKQTVNFSYTKTYSSDASKYGLRPANAYFRLYRIYDGGTEEQVTGLTGMDDGVITKSVASNNVTDTFSDLPAGTVVNGTDGIVGGVWKKYTYYIKEFDSADNTDIDNHYIYSNNNYNNTQLLGTEKPFELADNNTEANLTEGVKNTLRQTKHEVVKVWDDKDQPENRANYTISLQRKKINETNWVDVDLSDVKCSTIEKVQGSNDKITEITGIADNTSDYAVDMSKLHLSFEELPLYNKDGLKYEYRVVEKEIGGHNVRDNNTYLFFVPGTQATDDDFSYVRTVRRGTTNYYVDYDFDDTISTITNSVVTDTVAHSNFEATKIWDDENNVYGIRPESITFVLKRTKNGVLDGSFSSPKTVTSKENWHCIWEHCAAFAPNGEEFDYFVEEEPIANYSTTVKIDDTNNPKTRTYTFKNSYTPPKKKLTAKKTWDDQGNNFGLRPDSITFDLYCKYEGYDGLVYDSSKPFNEQSAVYKKRGGSSGDFSKPVTVDNTAHTTEVEFTNLPACVNPTGTATANGQAYSVTYYYKESFGNDTKNTLYKKLYQCGGTDDNCTSEEKSLFMTANEGSSITPVEGRYTVTPAINYANNGMIYFLIKNQPLMDNNGFPYTYNVTSSDGFTFTDSPFGSTAGHKDLLISKDVSSVPPVTLAAASYYFTVTRSKKVTNTQAVTDAAGTGITVTNSANGIYKFTIPANTASKTVTLNVLPLADNDNHNYTYTVKECDDKGHEYGSSTNFTSTIDNGVITVTKKLSDSPTADYTVYFKLSRSVRYIVTEKLTDDAVNITLSDASSGSPNTGGIFDKNGILTNTLETRDIIVAKSWEDNDYMKGEPDETNVLNGMHYHTKMTLSCDSLTSTTAGRSSSGHYEESKIIKKTDKNGVRFLSLPKYDSSGNVLEYSLKEEVFTPTAQDPLPTFATSPEDETFTSYCQISNAYNAANGDASFTITQASTEYEYQGSCTVKKDSNDNNVVTQYNVLNTLPLTAIKVVKTWNDQNNIYNLRPDSLALDLREKAVDPAILSGLDATTMSGWQESVWKTPQYSTHDSGSNKFPVKSDNTWTYTYKKLLKYDKENNPFVFRITETRPGAYMVPTYVNQYVSSVDESDKTTVGTTALNEEFKITNTLQTRNITVAKKWDDNGYANGSALHYNLDITLSSDMLTGVTDTNKNDGTSAKKYKEVLTIQKQHNGIIYKNMPIYDKNGNVIIYNVTENVSTSVKGTSKNVTFSDDGLALTNATGTPVFTRAGYKYGYTAGCTVNTTNQNDAGLSDADKLKGIATQYNITNTLPLTEVTVKKTWVDQNNVFGIRPGRVTYSLKRTTNASLGHDATSGWEEVTTSTHTVPTPDNTFTETYTKLLMYAENNDPYYFKVDETAVNGYTTTYPTAITTKTSKALAVTNTMDTIDIIAAKHWDDQGYSNGNDLHYNVKVTLASDDVTIPNDKKVLIINKTDGSGVKYAGYPKTNASGQDIVYKITEDATDETATKGSIALSNAYKNEGTATTTLFTQSTNRYGYDGSCKLDTDSSTDNMQFNIVNQLPVVNFTAQKEWEDENNRDYLRPGDIQFKLKRSLASTIPDNELTAAEIALKTTPEVVKTLTATAATSWKVDFGKQIEQSYSNKDYIYEVVEVQPAGYTQKSREILGATTQLADGTPNTDYKFTNKHDVSEQKLTVTKIWNDGIYKDTVRPDDLTKIEVELWCIYTGANGNEVNELVSTAGNRVNDHISSKKPSYDYDPTLNDFTAKPDDNTTTDYNENDYESTYEFTNLPVYINVDGDSTTAGTRKEAVTYYVKEIISVNGHVYVTDYSSDNTAYNTTPSASTGTTLTDNNNNPADGSIYVRNTPVMRDILVTKDWEDHGYGGNNADTGVTELSKNLHYNIEFTMTGNDSIPYNESMILAKADSDAGKGVVFKNVPIYKKDGTVISYKVTEKKVTTGTPASGADLGTPGSGAWTNYYTGNPTDAVSTEFEQLKGTGEYSYGYEGSAKKYSKTDSNRTYATRYAVKNTLPLTSAEVDKHWVDQHNEFGLRPSGINDKNRGENTADSINLTLSRKLGSQSTWTNLRPSTASEYTEWYTTASVIPSQNYGAGHDEWVYTYKKLLRYDVDNNSYTFRITEDQVNAYKEPHYCSAADYDDSSKTTEKQTVTSVDILAQSDAPWNGETALAHSFEITNRLDTRDIMVTKAWSDNNNANTHYDIDVTLSSDNANNGSYNSENHLDPNDNTSQTVSRNSGNKYKETKTITTTASDQFVCFYNLPKYDKNGNVIVFNVREDASASNNPKASDISGTAAQNSGTTYNLSTAPVFIDGDRHFGYVGNAVYTAVQDITDKPYATQFDITNTLPITNIKVQKAWVVNEELHKYVGTYQDGSETKNYRDIEVKLTRTSDGSDSDNTSTSIISPAFNSDAANTHTVSFNESTDSSPDYTYSDLLVYDYANAQYNYKLAETDQLGYTTTYSYTYTDSSSQSHTTTDGTIPAEEQTSSATQDITVTNTAITGDAEVVKINKSHYLEYHDKTGYTDETIPGAYFKLYQKDNSANPATDKSVNVRLLSSTDPDVGNEDGKKYPASYAGFYVIDERTDSSVIKSDIVVSGSDGSIKFKGLPLNTYYLKETAPVPEGFILNNNEYSFVIDVDSASDTTADPTVYTSTDYIEDNHVGNEEKTVESHLYLSKVDENDVRIKLSGATYRLLRMIPYEVRIATGSYTESEYNAAADNAIKTAIADANLNGNNTVLTSDVQNFWTKIGTDDYRTDANGNLNITGNFLITGRYALLEVQAPVGYKLSFLAPQELTDNHKHIIFKHKDPRKDADLKISKLDEFGDPLNGAKFDLYYRPVETETVSLYSYNDITISPPSPTETSSITPRTDNDYIFFMDDNNNGNDIWKKVSITTDGNLNYNDNYTLKATFFDSNHSVIGTYEMWERFVYYQNEKVIWKIQPPDGAKYVRFISCNQNQNSYDNCTNRTVEIEFIKGKVYFKSGPNNNDNNNQEWDVNVGSSNWTTSPGSSGVSYEATSNKIVFKLNHNRVWDNVHIQFFDDNSQVVGEPFPGYLMEPYAYAGSDYKIDGNLCYELTIPKGATKFQINNGINTGTDGNYATAITDIDLSSTDKKNFNNYWKFSSSSMSAYTGGALEKWPDNEITACGDTVDADASLTFEVDSDYDYVYFKDIHGWANSTGVMYAYYYSGTDLQADNQQRACYSVWPGIASVGRFVGSDGKYVYKFRRPMGDRRAYSSVIFNDGHSYAAGGNQTKTIGTYDPDHPENSYQLGLMYYPSNYDSTNNHWNCDSVPQYYSPASYTSTQTYTVRTYTDSAGTNTSYLYILNSAAAPWDDIHVKFYNQSDTQIHQDGVGYVAQDCGTDSNGHWYRIPIPTDAKKYSLNNGYNKGTNEKETPIYKIDELISQTEYENNVIVDPYYYVDRNDYTLDHMVVSIPDSANSESKYDLTKQYPAFIETQITRPVGSTNTSVPVVITNNQKTDYDYMYFTDNQSWIDNNHPTMYAHLFNGTSSTDTVWPGNPSDGSYVNSYGQSVYKFLIPDGDHTTIIFNNGTADYGNRHQSSSLTIQKGTGYFPEGSTYTPWQQATALYSIPYYAYDNNYIYFKFNINTNNKNSADFWDDPHICFFDENDYPILQPDPGYLLDDDGKDGGDKKYKILVPLNAKKFVLNNGSGKGQYDRRTVITEIHDGYTYSFEKDSSDNCVKDGSNYVLTQPAPPVVTSNTIQTGDIKLASIVTGDNGLTEKITWLKPEPGHDNDNPQTTVDAYYLANAVTDLNNQNVTDVRVVNWGIYYWVETEAPKGYDIDKAVLDTFTVGAEEADRNVNIDKASDTRKKGLMTLTKQAEQALGDIAAGDPLTGAQFELYAKGSPDVLKYLLKNGTLYTVAVVEAGKSEIVTVGSDKYLSVTDTDLMTKLSGYDVYGDGDPSHFMLYDTGTVAMDGKLHINGLEWGEYYLKETVAPAGFSTNDTATSTNNVVSFSVGRNNCSSDQQLICTDEIIPAKIKIKKVLDEYIEAWGTPTFIFKIKKLSTADSATEYERTVSLQVTDSTNKTAETDYIDIEPGQYEVTEVNVSRYSVTDCKVIDDSNVTTVNDPSADKKAILTFSANGQATVEFDNTIDYYDKFTHTDSTINHFGCYKDENSAAHKVYKGIKVEYDEPVAISESANSTITLSKGSGQPFKAYLIRTDGQLEQITSTAVLSQIDVSYTYDNTSDDDSRFTVTDDTANGTFTVTNSAAITAGCSYKLKAVYDGFETYFDLRFAERPHPGKNIKTVVFKADINNMSYFLDGTNRSDTYSYVYTIPDPGDTTVTHNGLAVAALTDPPTLTINEGYISAKELYNWQNGTQSYTSAELISHLNTWLAQPGDDTIVFTVNLKNKSSP